MNVIPFECSFSGCLLQACKHLCGRLKLSHCRSLFIAAMQHRRKGVAIDVLDRRHGTMRAMFALPRFAGKALARYLSTPRPSAETGTPSDPRKLLQCLQPCDVLLVEGSTRISTAIKYLTQSTWSHAALYVGPQLGGTDEEGHPYLFVEADIVQGVC